jgi:hypothetical protein
LLGAGALLWYILSQVGQHISQAQQVEPDEQFNPNEDPGADGNQIIL